MSEPLKGENGLLQLSVALGTRLAGVWLSHVKTSFLGILCAWREQGDREILSLIFFGNFS